MANVLVPQRSEIDPKYTWNAPSVFESDKAWERAFQKILESLPAMESQMTTLQ